MGLVKIVKNKAYFKRFQVKFRRRREGKTDYFARRRLIWQDKNKYNTPKYRLVVRFTNKDILVQVIYARMDGDKVFTSASSRELQRYGLKAGFTNYSAAYCTGLLVARRLLNKIKLDETFEGVSEVTGVKLDELPEDTDKGAFICYLDVGLKRTTTGSNIFGVLKGAVDGGLEVPHKEKRFPGYDAKAEDESSRYDPEVHKRRILGGHVADYMRHLEENEPEEYRAHFSQYINAGLGPDDLESMYRAVHKAIREDPSPIIKEKRTMEKKKRWNRAKITLKQRKDRVRQLKSNFADKMKKELMDDDDED